MPISMTLARRVEGRRWLPALRAGNSHGLVGLAAVLRLGRHESRLAEHGGDSMFEPAGVRSGARRRRRASTRLASLSAAVAL